MLLSPDNITSAPISPCNSSSMQEMLRVSNSDGPFESVQSVPSSVPTNQEAQAGLPAQPRQPVQPVDVKSSKEYLDLANELLVAKEHCVSLNVSSAPAREA